MRIFYRIVETDPPVLRDFESNRAKGRPMRKRELAQPSLYAGISVYAKLTQARRTVRRYPRLGAAVAELRIPEDAPVAIQRTLGPGHYTLTGDASLLLSYVTAVWSVE